MTNNPLFNALIAGAYILCIASLFWLVATVSPKEDNILMPIAGLSLFVLSAASMAVFFFYTPIALMVEGKKAEAFKLVTQTIIAFAIFTFVVFVLIMIVPFSPSSAGSEPVHTAQIANPASAHCVKELHGTLTIQSSDAGQVGYCHMPDGAVCEEWALFRDNTCVAPSNT